MPHFTIRVYRSSPIFDHLAQVKGLSPIRHSSKSTTSLLDNGRKAGKEDAGVSPRLVQDLACTCISKHQNIALQKNVGPTTIRTHKAFFIVADYGYIKRSAHLLSDQMNAVAEKNLNSWEYSFDHPFPTSSERFTLNLRNVVTSEISLRWNGW